MSDAEPSIDPAAPGKAYDVDATTHGETPVVEEQRSSRVPLVLATVGAVLVLGAALAAPLVDKALRG